MLDGLIARVRDRVAAVSRAGWRRIIIALITLLVGSAILTPQYNPLTRSGMRAANSLPQVWNEVNQWRMAMMEAMQIEEDWPGDLQAYAPPGAGRWVEMSSPRPFRLVATIRNDAELGALAGRQIVLDLERSGRWECAPGKPPVPPRYLPTNCQGSEVEVPVIGWLRNIILVCLAVFLIAAVLLALRHPLLVPLQLRPESLLRLPVSQLPRLDRLLGLLMRRESTLLAACVRLVHWRAALGYPGAVAIERLKMLGLRVGATCGITTDWPLPGEVAEWRFAAGLPITLDRCLVYLPDPVLSDEEVVQHLRTVQTGIDVILVVVGDAADAVIAYCADTANLCVALQPEDQTEWLLSSRPLDVLLRALSTQLRLTRISPYQTRGGVVRADAFFGRTELLARVLNREPANYLVVGGRQLGKTSLLKAVQRRLADHPHIACHYLSLRDHRLAPRLALQFGLAPDTPLEKVVAHLGEQHAGKRLFLLIDEADLFFRDESVNDYGQLATLRSLSDEGRCWFMLAGFWDLYATAVLDYQSPLRNFGELITIGGLERAACRELATVPLARLRLGFAGTSLVDEVVEASGQRANLVAIICQECLESLEPGERAIERRHLERALRSRAVDDTLAGWGRLTHDEAASRIDRVIVYQVARHGRSTLAELVALFEQAGAGVEVDALTRGLARLQLAHVLRRDGLNFRFAVPLLERQFEQGELNVLLRQELQGAKRVTQPGSLG